MERQGFGEWRRRPSATVVVLVAALHLALFYGLLRAFAPATLESVQLSVVAAFSVAAPPPPAPPTPHSADKGAAGAPGKRAVPKPKSAPSPPVTVRRDPSAPHAASSGLADTSGARNEGAGTGASGEGEGTGSGRGGAGQGGGPVTRPVKLSGDINSAADFPPPPGGRQARFGTSVTVYMTVGVDGRARNCRVVRASPDPQADAIVCQLAEQRFRFRPARDADGDAVPATYGWRQEWFAR